MHQSAVERLKFQSGLQGTAAVCNWQGISRQALSDCALSPCMYLRRTLGATVRVNPSKHVSKAFCRGRRCFLFHRQSQHRDVSAHCRLSPILHQAREGSAILLLVSFPVRLHVDLIQHSPVQEAVSVLVWSAVLLSVKEKPPQVYLLL